VSTLRSREELYLLEGLNDAVPHRAPFLYPLRLEAVVYEALYHCNSAWIQDGSSPARARVARNGELLYAYTCCCLATLDAPRPGSTGGSTAQERRG